MINFETKWYTVETEDNYTRIIHKNRWNNRPFAGVVILTVVDDKILLLKVDRKGTNRQELEFPRGCSEPQQSPEENACRELQEEIGVIPQKLVFLGNSIADTSWGTGDVYLYYAEVNKIGNLQSEEGIKDYFLVTLPELLELIAKNKIQDGFTLSAIAKAFAKGLLHCI